MIPKEYIQFADPEVERVCIENWSSDGIGVTVQDAEKVTSLDNKFQGNTLIETFDELNLFINVTKINLDEFSECKKLRKVSLSNITYLNFGAFRNSGIDMEIVSPKLKNIYAGAFYNTKISKVNDLGAITSIEETANNRGGVFEKCAFLENVILPDTLQAIGQNAFYECSQLSYVSLPNTLTKIGVYAFGKCTALSNITFPKNLTTIKNGAFYKTSINGDINMPNLTELGGGVFNSTKINSVTNLGNIQILYEPSNNSGGTFENCTELKKAILPTTLQTIGTLTFGGCLQLKEIIVNAITPPSLSNKAFVNTSSDLLIYVPDESVEAYKTATGWIDYADKIKPISEYVEQ